MMSNNRWTIAIAGDYADCLRRSLCVECVSDTSQNNSAGISEVTLTFTIASLCSASRLSSAVYGLTKGPRVVALTGGLVYALGVFLELSPTDFGGCLSYG